MNKPFAESAVENREPILQVLRDLFRDRKNVIEFGSGTGQHAVYFARAMPHLVWQPTDVISALDGIRAWIKDEGATNLRDPVALDVATDTWPEERYDAAFSANTAHIMSWPEVVALFDGLSNILAPGAFFALYGPFHSGGKPTSESNARFDLWLRARDPNSGVRNFEDLDDLARNAGMHLLNDYAMPVNNRILVWVKD